MRKDDDIRDKVSVKKDIFRENFSKEEIFITIENDKDLVALWRGLGLKTKATYEV